MAVMCLFIFVLISFAAGPTRMGLRWHKLAPQGLCKVKRRGHTDGTPCSICERSPTGGQHSNLRLPCAILSGASQWWSSRATGVVTLRGPHDGLLLGFSLSRVRSLLSFLLRVLAHSTHDSISDQGCSGYARAIAQAARIDAIISRKVGCLVLARIKAAGRGTVRFT